MSGIGGMCRAKTELRWMRFVDGENFVLEGGKFLKDRFNLTTDLDISSPFFKKDHFLWLPSKGWSAVTI